MPTIGVPSVDTLHDTFGLLLSANAVVATARFFMSSRPTPQAASYLRTEDATQAGAYRLLGMPVSIFNGIPDDGGVGGNE